MATQGSAPSPAALPSPCTSVQKRGLAGDGFLYSGNRHEAVPVALFHDRRLTPLERNAWQVLRLLMPAQGLTIMPGYDPLRAFLASMPGTLASYETIARVFTVLRLTRWLSLVRRRRDARTGRILGNVYVLHDEPLTPFEAIQLDATYFELTCKAQGHASKAVRIVGRQVLDDILQDPMMKGRLLPNRLEVLMQRLVQQEEREAYPQGKVFQGVSESEEGQKTPSSDSSRPPSDSEEGRKPAPIGLLRNPKPDSTVSISNKVRTEKDDGSTPRADARGGLRIPELFRRLKGNQQQAVFGMLAQLEAAQQQAVLDEWAARWHTGNVKINNPAGYLCGIIQKAVRGEFTVWAASKGASSQQTSALRTPPVPEKAKVTDPEVVQMYREQMNSLFRKLR
ncbi:MAG: hypothetical protein LBP99_02395 [Azoarcus sp.]|jgi:hypothetical protein|nr:hypothetical protein [Azoarcus sp.]